jgi:salicylate synthase
MVYEHPEGFCWVEGERARLVVSGTAAVLTMDGEERTFPYGATMFDGVRQALSTLPFDHWRVYGWVAFEVAHGPGTQEPVVHLVLPQREIRLFEDSVLLMAGSETELDGLHERLIAASIRAERPPEQGRVEIDLNGDDAVLYHKAATDAIDSIRAGHLDKVILSRVVPVRQEIDLAATYLVGRKGNNPARSFVLNLGGWEAAGFSPEIVARVTPGGDVVTQPLAGTRALDGIPTFDSARRDELYRDAKEVFEHAISVHLAATEMAAVCTSGTVHIRDFMSVKERGSVQHLSSEVVGRLAVGLSRWHALSALFPAVTASGIPKGAACELIQDVEQERGLYSGAVLVADADGTLDAALVLRSVFRRAGRTWLRAGAGVVGQSSPTRELEETREKLLSVARFLVPDPAGANPVE